MRKALVVGCAIYLLFAVANFRLAFIGDGLLALWEGLFVLLGAVAMGVAVRARRHRSLIVLAGTLPLTFWFAATPWNSGTGFLVASLVAPVAAAASLASGRAARASGRGGASRS